MTALVEKAQQSTPYNDHSDEEGIAIGSYNDYSGVKGAATSSYNDYSGEERGDLNKMYNEILLDFENALEYAQDLISRETYPHQRPSSIWLENILSSLTSWGTDIRVEEGSLRALEGTPMEFEIQGILQELRIQLKRTHTEKKANNSVSNNAEKSEKIALEPSSNLHKGESKSDDDAQVIISDLIGLLQDATKSIRMLHASNLGSGPYHMMKQRIDSIYNTGVMRENACEVESHKTYPSSRSVSSSIGNRILPMRILEQHPQQPLSVPPPPGPTIYECPFIYLHCLLTFGNFTDWYAHSLTHFEGAGPPTHAECCFCDDKFQHPIGDVCWKSRMEHVELHHQWGHRLSHARPALGMMRYLWERNIIDNVMYRELSGAPASKTHENPVSPRSNDSTAMRPTSPDDAEDSGSVYTFNLDERKRERYRRRQERLTAAEKRIRRR